MRSLYDIRGASAFVQTTTSATTSVSAPAGATACLISADNAGLRVTFDGTAASTTIGHYIPASQIPAFFPVAKTIGISSASTTVVTSNVTWLF